MKREMMPELFAWVGEDELGRETTIGLKQALVPAGMIPMVATKREKMDQPMIVQQMQAQTAQFGKTIYLVRFVAVEILKKVR